MMYHEGLNMLFKSVSENCVLLRCLVILKNDVDISLGIMGAELCSPLHTSQQLLKGYQNLP